MGLNNECYTFNTKYYWCNSLNCCNSFTRTHSSAYTQNDI